MQFFWCKDMKNIEVRYNSEWLRPMSIPDLGKLLECFTVQQMTKRRNFKTCGSGASHAKWRTLVVNRW